ncbi:MAG: type II toxin-antitoxin system prevent-host-death family antitoxin [Acetobacteraceae bacterium]|nr:type II toxin-antitoxin system prevent-host-death family antitoxin [Acetobacteraceae bacterium]
MGHVTFTDLRQRMARYFDQVTDNREPLIVTRQGGKGNVVIMSEAEFDGWRETVHLLSSPKNAARLLESVRQARAGEVLEHDLPAAGPPA